MPEPLIFRKTIDPGDIQPVCDLLAQTTGLPKARIKDAMNKGAVWCKPAAGRQHRLRRATALLQPGDQLALYYDADILKRSPPSGHCVSDRRRFSVWVKPAGLLTQGTRFGDHCAILRQAERSFRPRRPVYPVHRLDREAAGLLLIAHDRTAAARLSRLLREKRLVKRYLAAVKGRPAALWQEIRIDRMLDGRPAVTRYTVQEYDAEHNLALIEAKIDTGRRHQIRRHLAWIGHPVMGDPRYGRENKNTTGLKLWAVGLEFRCPFSGRQLCFEWQPPLEERSLAGQDSGPNR